jgi:hypothetical protein
MATTIVPAGELNQSHIGARVSFTDTHGVTVADELRSVVYGDVLSGDINRPGAVWVGLRDVAPKVLVQTFDTFDNGFTIPTTTPVELITEDDDTTPTEGA